MKTEKVSNFLRQNNSDNLELQLKIFQQKKWNFRITNTELTLNKEWMNSKEYFRRLQFDAPIICDRRNDSISKYANSELHSSTILIFFKREETEAKKYFENFTRPWQLTRGSKFVRLFNIFTKHGKVLHCVQDRVASVFDFVERIFVRIFVTISRDSYESWGKKKKKRKKQKVWKREKLTCKSWQSLSLWLAARITPARHPHSLILLTLSLAKPLTERNLFPTISSRNLYAIIYDTIKNKNEKQQQQRALGLSKGLGARLTLNRNKNDREYMNKSCLLDARPLMGKLCTARRPGPEDSWSSNNSEKLHLRARTREVGE